jgi:hypothetical protein
MEIKTRTQAIARFEKFLDYFETRNLNCSYGCPMAYRYDLGLHDGGYGGILPWQHKLCKYGSKEDAIAAARRGLKAYREAKEEE